MSMKRLFVCLLAVIMAVGMIPGFGGNSVSAGSGYMVMYNGNGHKGGDVPYDITVYDPGDPVVVHDNSNGLTKEGYVFGGWNTEPDGSGTDYLPGQTFPMGTGHVTLYAKWIDPLTSWVSRSADIGYLHDVAYLDGVFVAVGNDGAIFASIDRDIWTKQPSGINGDLYGVAAGSDRLVAVGEGGVVVVSTNGTDWFSSVSGTASTLRSVAYGGDRFVAVGDDGTIVTSANGSYWIAAESGTTTALNAVAYTGERFVAVGSAGTILTSPDGKEWTAQTSGTAEDLYGVGAGNGTITAVGATGTVLTSGDGETWDGRTSGSTADLKDVLFTGGAFLAVGSGGAMIGSDDDGATWSTVASGITYGLTGIAWGNNVFVAVGGSVIVSSPDGSTWSEYQAPSLMGITYANGMFVAVGGSGFIFTSDKGVLWKRQSSDNTYMQYDVTYGNGRFVAAGQVGRLITSDDGVNWEIRYTGASSPLQGVAYGAGRYVGVGGNGTVVVSDDGESWSLRNVGDPSITLYAVSYGTGKFVSVGVKNTASKIYTSTDGTSWSDADLNGVRLYEIYGNDDLFVAAGSDSSGSNPTLNIYTSEDGSTWTARDSGTSKRIDDVTYSDGAYVYVGYQSALGFSRDGVNWTNVPLNISSDLQGVAGGGGLFVAVGQFGGIVHTKTEAPVRYTVRFDANGGDWPTSPAFMMVMPGDALGDLPDPPKRPGYRFLGWNLEFDGTGTTVDESFVPDGDKFVYAHWEQIPLPPAPTNVAVADGIGEATLTWDAAAEADSYAVYMYEGDEAPEDPEGWVLVQADITETTYTVEGLTDGQSYTFAVASVNEDGIGPYSDAVTAVPGGNGTADHPYLIANAQQLDEVRHDLDAYYVLVDDIDLSGIGPWTPIGWNEAQWTTDAFTGRFDGQGHTISGLTVPDAINAGLFAAIGNGGEVRNLVLSNVAVASSVNYGSAGALAGRLKGTAADIRVSGGTVSGLNHVGGLVGHASDGAVIEASCTDVTVTGDSMLGNYTGGLVGYLEEGSINASCATGAVSGSWSVGGLVGLIAGGEITDSYAAGAVSGYTNVGGLIGGAEAPQSTLTRVFAAGNVTGEMDWSTGGLIGARYNLTVMTLTSAFYDKDQTGRSDADDLSGTPTAHVDMVKASTFAGWDFTTLWHLDERDEMPTFLRNDVTAPVMSGAKVANETPDRVSVYFPEPIVADAEASSRFAVSVDGSAAQIVGAQWKDKELVLTLDGPVLNSQEVEIVYADGEPPVVDKRQNRMDDQTILADNEVEPNIKIVAYDPADDATDVAVDTALTLTFNDTVYATSGKFIRLVKEGDIVVETIEATDSRVHIADQTVTIALSGDLAPLTGYSVLIDAGAFRHSENDVHGGIAEPGTWNFFTAPDPAARWVSAGNAFTAGVANTPVLKAGADGTLYVLFRDEANDGKATVMKRGADDAQWSTVGSAGFSQWAIGIPSLLVDGDTLYAAFGVVDQDNMAYVHVMKYDLKSDGDWTQAGLPIEVGEYVPYWLWDQDSAPYLIKHNGAVLVGYRDGTSFGGMTVRKLTGSGDWEPVGTPQFSPGDIYDPSLVVLNGTLYAGFTDYMFDADYGATVMKFNEGTGSWELVGRRGFTDGNAFGTSLVTVGERLFVVYENKAHKAAAMMFDAARGEWVAAGDSDGFSSGEAYVIAAVSKDGGLYAAYRDTAHDDRLTVMKYTGSGWAEVGSPGLTTGKIYEPSLLVHDDVLYVVYEDGYFDGKLSAVKYGVFNLPPEALDVGIDGTLEVGQTVTGTYEFVDDENDEEGESFYQWYAADSEDGSDRVALSGATALTLELTDDHVGKYLIFEVTPVAATGTLQGVAAAGDPVGPVVPGAPNVTVDDTLNVIVGADATMEYSTDGGTTYTPYDPLHPPTFKGNVTVKVRIAADEAAGKPAGADKTLTFTANQSAISPTTASFDKHAESAGYKDVATTMTLNGNTLSGIAVGATTLVSGKDYTVNGSTVTIKKAYLAKRPIGTTTLTFTFSDGDPQTLTVTITDSTPIKAEAPVLYTAVPGDAEVDLTWSPVIGATGYKVFVREESQSYGAATATVADSVYSYTVTELTNGTTYYFVVKAVKSGIDSDASNEMSAVPRTVPAAPTNVSATAGDGQATVSFTPPGDNGGTPIIMYEVTASPGGQIATGTSSPIVVTGLTNGVSYTFTVKAVNSVGSSVPSAPSNAVVPSAPSGGGDDDPTEPVSPTNPEPTEPEPSEPEPTPNEPEAAEPELTDPGPADDSVAVLINGKEERAGTAVTSTRDDRTVTTVVLDADKLEEKLAEEGVNAVVTIPVPSGSDVAVGELNGRMVKNMEAKQAVLELVTDRAAYRLPAEQLNIDAIAGQFGAAVALEDIKVQVEIGAPSADTARLVADAAADGTFTLVVPPVEFTVRATYGDTTVEVVKFDAYVERTIALPDGVDPNRITTGVVVDADGTVRHVPTRIIVVDGRYYAVINSLTNSAYTVVWNSVEFTDVAAHWAKDTVNNMGSRLIMAGTGGGRFSPERDVTRAEFAAMVVRALGLGPEEGAGVFPDVQASDWYDSAVRTAYAYGLMGGFDDGTFRPDDKITREQAMVVIARAMGLTGLAAKLPDAPAEAVLGAYADTNRASAWAIDSIADCVQAGIVAGRSGGMLAPQDTVTRAEAATMVERLLQMSDLI
jgi:uncharacterized repeat protein (TIGR02543 family)